MRRALMCSICRFLWRKYFQATNEPSTGPFQKVLSPEPVGAGGQPSDLPLVHARPGQPCCLPGEPLLWSGPRLSLLLLVCCSVHAQLRISPQSQRGLLTDSWRGAGLLATSVGNPSIWPPSPPLEQLPLLERRGRVHSRSVLRPEGHLVSSSCSSSPSLVQTSSFPAIMTSLS